jgi:PhnB protein
MFIQPYLFFEGRCVEAIEFYKKALGAEVTSVMRFKDGPPGSCPPGTDPELVMHSAFRVGDTTVMAADGMKAGTPKFEGFSLAVYFDDDAQAARRFAALGEGGQVQQPIIKSFFASSFGMVKDRFGVSWMVLAGVVDKGGK